MMKVMKEIVKSKINCNINRFFKSLMRKYRDTMEAISGNTMLAQIKISNKISKILIYFNEKMIYNYNKAQRKYISFSDFFRTINAGQPSAAVNSLRCFGLDTSKIVRGGERVGIYYPEKGASQRGSVCVYDRKYSRQSLPILTGTAFLMARTDVFLG